MFVLGQKERPLSATTLATQQQKGQNYMRANSVPNFDHAVKLLEAVQSGQLEFSDLTVAEQESVISLLELVVSQL